MTAEERTRRILIESNLSMDRIESLMDEVDSPYATARELLFQAKMSIGDAKKVSKLLKTAKAYVEKESSVAYCFNEAMDYLDKYPSSDKKVESLITKYKEDIRKRKYKAASKKVGQIKAIAGFGRNPLHVTISQLCGTYSDEGFEVTVNNNTGKDITIERITATSRTGSVESLQYGSITLAENDQRTFCFKNAAPSGDLSVRVCVDYLLGFEHHTQSRVLTYRRA